jgi:hypothetical protein
MAFIDVPAMITQVVIFPEEVAKSTKFIAKSILGRELRKKDSRDSFDAETWERFQRALWTFNMGRHIEITARVHDDGRVEYIAGKGE